MLARYMLSSCVLLSHTVIAQKRLNLESRKQRHTISQGLVFCDADFGEIPTRSPQQGAN